MVQYLFGNALIFMVKINTPFTIYIIDFKLIINIFIISEKR